MSKRTGLNVVNIIPKMVEDITEYFKLKESEKTKKIEYQEKFESIRTHIQAVKEIMISGIDHHYQHLDKIYFQIAASQEKLVTYYSQASSLEEKQMLMDMIKLESEVRSKLIQSENLSDIKLPKQNIEEINPRNIERIISE